MADRIAQLQSFLQKTPDDCFLNHALALEYVKLGDDAQARTYFDKNLAFDKGYVATYYHLGKLLERNNETEAAIATYEAGMLAAQQAGDRHTYNELQSAHEDLVY